MRLLLIVDNQTYNVSPQAIDISIPLQFNGEQPNSYGVDRATSEAFDGGGFVGDVRRGGSCNFEIYRFIPHCNGTHTECVGHITEERFSVHELLKDSFIPATLISVTPIAGKDSGESYQPTFGEKDQVISQKMLENALNHRATDFFKAIVIRTLPNDVEKMSRDYTQIEPPFFTLEAMQYLRNLGVQHLLVDMPSVDRLHDEGKLSAHHIFWQKNKGESFENPPLFTITEFIYVPNEVRDGRYLLNLQIAPFMSDASPSRPRLFSLT
jgi:arylformamidase